MQEGEAGAPPRACSGAWGWGKEHFLLSGKSTAWQLLSPAASKNHSLDGGEVELWSSTLGKLARGEPGREGPRRELVLLSSTWHVLCLPYFILLTALQGGHCYPIAIKNLRLRENYKPRRGLLEGRAETGGGLARAGPALGIGRAAGKLTVYFVIQSEHF